MSFLKNFFKPKDKVVFTVYPQGDKKSIHKVEALDGDNLLDTLNDQNISELSVFGLCDKNLACHSCRINVMKGIENFPEIQEDEKDVLYELDRLYIPDCTRMSCQIKIQKSMEGAEIEIPRSAFAFYEKQFGDDDWI